MSELANTPRSTGSEPAAASASPADDEDNSTIGGGRGNPNEPPEAAATRRPLDTALRQQRMKSWQPILDPTWVIGSLFVIGICFLATGLVLRRNSNALVELSITYDAPGYNTSDKYDKSMANCSIADPNQNRTCTLTFPPAPKDMDPPIFIHYQITDFYQNHRRYVKSRDDIQLRGETNPDPKSLGQKRCRPLLQLGNQTLNPCGLIANTLFNDVISLSSGRDANGADLAMREDGIAWQSDMQYKFKQVNGFKSEACSSCDNCNCTDGQWSCDTPYRDKNGVCHKYFYPEDETTTYLYETYPMVVNPLEGVTNEHFVVWMRTAALPQFRKLYGWFDKPIKEGEVLTFDVLANWEVQSFRGTKSLLVSTSDAFGGKNKYLGQFFWILGVVFIVVGALFGAKHCLKPRKLGDPRYLKYKED